MQCWGQGRPPKEVSLGHILKGGDGIRRQDSHELKARQSDTVRAKQAVNGAERRVSKTGGIGQKEPQGLG